MALNREQILKVIIENEVKGGEKLAKQGKLVKELRTETGELTRVFETQTGSERRRLTVKEKTLKNGENQVKVGVETLAQGPKFQAHFLGLMFGGMALNRAMSNLTATSMEWVGIGELMSTTMGVVMLPATLELLDKAVLPLMEALLGLPEDVKLSIGLAVFGLQGVGGLLEVIGQIALFKLAFPAAFAKITGITASVLSLSGVLTILAVAMAAFAFKAWIDDLADFSKAWNDLGDSVETTSDILGQAGQGTRTIAPPKLSGADKASSDKSFEEMFPRFIGPLQPTRSKELDKFITPGFLESIKDIDRQDDFNKPRGFFAVGGNVTNTGLHFLHEGETVLRKDQVNNQSGSISVTYNVNVSDKREFEQMLRVNNQQLVRDVRRDSRI